MRRALVIGAGVAGTAAAMALQRAGVEPLIFEAYAQSSGLTHGVYVTVAVNGLDALKAIDAHHGVMERGFPTGRMEFYSSSGRRLGAMRMGPELDDGTVTHTIKRSELYSYLLDEAVGRGIEVRHGKRLVDVARTATGVRAVFADGTTAEGDIVVGADGIHSVTRTLIDPTAPLPRYTGVGNIGGFARVPAVATRPGTFVMTWGKRCFFGYVASPDGELWWFANPPSRSALSREQLRWMGPDEFRDQLVDLFRGDRTPAAKIVQADRSDLHLFNQYDLPTVPRWHAESMVLIGDAAHAVNPASGQGVSLACEDAVVLAKCLRDLPDVPQALAAFEQLRRARVERVVAWGSKMGDSKAPGRLGRYVRALALPFILKRGATDQAMNEMSWLFTHHIDWDETIQTAPEDGATIGR